MAVGNTSGSFCKRLAKTVNEVEEWNPNPKDYELPCDFITYFH